MAAFSGSLQAGHRLGSLAGLESSRHTSGVPVAASQRRSRHQRSHNSQVTQAVAAPPNSLERAVADSFTSQPAGLRRSAEDDVQMSKTVLGIILGGGAGSRLYPLTKTRAKPAVPLGANYRLIDIPVSNCINSGVNKIYCMTQFNSASLNRHLASAYNANVGSYSNEGFVEVLAATQSPKSTSWFQGTADAVRQYLWLFENIMRIGVEDFLILSGCQLPENVFQEAACCHIIGDHLYRMDYTPFVQKHRETGADITVAALPMDEARAEAFGVMKINDTGRIVDFAEKPKGAALKAMEVDTTVLGLDAERAKEMPFIASMGIYVVKASAITELLTKHFPTGHDFGSEIIPGAKDLGYRVQAHLYDGYWEDIGTIKAFYESNLALTDQNPNFSFYDKDSPIYTMSRFLPPSKVLDAEVSNSILGDGCVVRAGTTISHSVIGLRSLIGENCLIEDSLLMGSDYFETLEECALLPGCLPVGLGPGCTVKKAIIDKNSRIGANVQIINKDGVQEANREEEGFLIKDGIIVVTKGAVLTAGTII